MHRQFTCYFNVGNCLCSKRVTDYIYMGNSLKLDTKLWCGNQEWKTFQIIFLLNIPNNIKIHVPMIGCMLFMSELKKTFIPVDLDLIHIEQYHLRHIKIRHIQNIVLICATIPYKILLITIKQTRLCLSRIKN